MEISDEALHEFVSISREEYDYEISIEDARVIAIRLMLFYELIARPLPGEKSSK